MVDAGASLAKGIGNLLNGSPAQNGSQPTSQGALSFAYVDDQNHTLARIGAPADVEAGETIAVTGSVTSRPDVTAQSQMKSAEGQGTKNGMSLAISLGSYWNDADALIAGGAQVDARGAITVKAEALNRIDPNGLWGANVIVPLIDADTSLSDGDKRFDYFRTLATYWDDKGNLGLDANLVDSWSQASASGQEERSVAGALTVLRIDHDADATIETGALINQDAAVGLVAVDPSAWSSGTNTLQVGSGTPLALDGTVTFVVGTKTIDFGTGTHGFADGDIVTYATDLPNDSSGLEAGSTYRVVRVDDSKIKLAARTRSVEVESSSVSHAINLAGNFPPLLDAIKAAIGSSSASDDDPGKAVGATFLWFEFENDALAKIADGVQLYADSLKVKAANNVVNIALGISGGESEDFGFNGVGMYVSVDNTAIAQVDDGASVVVGTSDVVEVDDDGIATSRGVSALVEATDATYVVSVAGGMSQSEKAGIGATVAINDITRLTEALIGNRPGESDDAGSFTVAGDAEITAENDGFIGAFAIAGAKAKAPDDKYVRTSGAGAVAFASNTVADSVRAYVSDANLSAGSDVTLRAVFRPTLEAFALGGAYAAGDANSIALAGAVALNAVDSTIEAYIRDSALTWATGSAGDLSLIARDESGVFAQTGAVSIASGSGQTNSGSRSLSIGASVTINEVGDEAGHAVRAYIDNSTLVVNGSVSLSATYAGELEALAVGGSFSRAPSSVSGSGSYAVAAAGAFASNKLDVDVEAYIAASSDITTNSAGDVTATAEADSDLIRADAFGIAAAYAASATAGTTAALAFGVAIASNTVSIRSNASIRNSRVDAAGSVELTSTVSPDIDALAIGVAGSLARGSTGTTGALAGAGSASTNYVDNTVAAYVVDSGTIATPGVEAGTTITLSAADATNVRADAGGFAIGLSSAMGTGTAVAAAVGAGITINEIGERAGHSVSAYIDNSVLLAGGNIDLSATSTAEVDALAMGGAGAGSSSQGRSGALAGAGAGSYNVVRQTIESYISADSDVRTTVNGGGDISLSALDRSAITADAGGVAVAVALTGGSGSGTGSGSVGAAIAENTISNSVEAYIAASNVIADGDVSLSAFARPQAERSLAFGASEVELLGDDSITFGSPVTVNTSTLVRDGGKVWRYGGSASALFLGDVDYDAAGSGWTDVTSSHPLFIPDPGNNRYDSGYTTSGHGLHTGDLVVYHVGSGAGLGSDLVDGKSYFVIRDSANTIRLAETSDQARKGEAIELTDPGSGSYSLELLKDSIDALAFGVAVSGSGSSGSGLTGALAGAGAGATNIIDNTIAAYIEDADDAMKVKSVAGGVTLNAGDESTIVADAGGYAIALAANLGSGTSGAGSVGASVASNEIGMNGGHSVTATIRNSIVEAAAGGVAVIAASAANVDALSVGGAAAAAGSSSGSAFALGVGGAFTDNTIDLTVEASVKAGSTVTTSAAGDVTVNARDSSRIYSESVGGALGGSLSGSGSTGAVAVGVSIADNTIVTDVAAFIESDGSAAASVPANIVDAAGGIVVTATQDASIGALAVAASLSIAGSGSGSSLAVSGGGAAATNIILSRANAYVANTPKIHAAGDIDITAIGASTIDATIVAVSVSAAFGSSNAGSLSIGAALARNEIGRGRLFPNEVRAYIENSSVDAGGDLTVTASMSGSIDAGVGAGSAAISGSGSGLAAGLSGAGASARNEIAVDVKATIDGDGSPVSGPGIIADSVTLLAEDTSSISADVGAASLAAAIAGTNAGALSVGVALAKNRIDNAVEASISGADDGVQTRVGEVTITASELAAIEAVSVAASLSIAGGSSNALAVSGAGANATNIILTKTNAFVANSIVDSAGALDINATASSDITATVGGVSGAGAVGGSAGGAASVGAAIARNYIGWDPSPMAADYRSDEIIADRVLENGKTVEIADGERKGDVYMYVGEDRTRYQHTNSDTGVTLAKNDLVKVTGIPQAGIYQYTGSGASNVNLTTQTYWSSSSSWVLIDSLDLSAQDFGNADLWRQINLTADAAQVRAFIQSSTVTAAGNITLDANAGGQIETVVFAGSAAIGVGGTPGVALSGAGVSTENRIKTEVKAFIDGDDGSVTPGSGVISAHDVILRAHDASVIRADAVAASIAGALGGTGGVAISIGVSLAYNEVNNDVGAYIADVDRLTAGGDIVIDARSLPGSTDPATFDLNDAGHTSVALTAGQTVRLTDQYANGGQAGRVYKYRGFVPDYLKSAGSQDVKDGDTVFDGTQTEFFKFLLGDAYIGTFYRYVGADPVNTRESATINLSTATFAGNSAWQAIASPNTRDLTQEDYSNTRLWELADGTITTHAVAASLAASFGSTGGVSLAGAGAKATNVVLTKNNAFITNSEVLAGGDVDLDARNDSRITAVVAAASVAAAGGGTGGVGASIGVSIAHNFIGVDRDGVLDPLDRAQIRAYIEDSRVLAAGDLELDAAANEKIDAGVGAGSAALAGGGVAGVGLSGAGVETTNRISTEVKAYIDNAEFASGGLIDHLSTAGTQSVAAGDLVKLRNGDIYEYIGAPGPLDLAEAVQDYANNENWNVVFAIDVGGGIGIRAADTSAISATAAAASLAVSFGGTAGVSVSIGVTLAENTISNEVLAYIVDADVVARGGSIVVEANEDAEVYAFALAASLSAAFGTVGVALSGAGADATNIISNDVQAYVLRSNVATLPVYDFLSVEQVERLQNGDVVKLVNGASGFLNLGQTGDLYRYVGADTVDHDSADGSIALTAGDTVLLADDFDPLKGQPGHVYRYLGFVADHQAAYGERDLVNGDTVELSNGDVYRYIGIGTVEAPAQDVDLSVETRYTDAANWELIPTPDTRDLSSEDYTDASLWQLNRIGLAAQFYTTTPADWQLIAGPASQDVRVEARSTATIDALVGAASGAIAGGAGAAAGSVGASIARNLIGMQTTYLESETDATLAPFVTVRLATGEVYAYLGNDVVPHQDLTSSVQNYATSGLWWSLGSPAQNQVRAFVDASSLFSASDITVSAESAERVGTDAFAGSVALAVGTGGAVAGAGVGLTTQVGTVVNAYLNESDVYATEHLDVQAVSDSRIVRANAIAGAVSAAAGLALSVAATTVDNTIASDVQSWIAGSAGKTVMAGGTVRVLANAEAARIEGIGAVGVAVSGGIVAGSGVGIDIRSTIANQVGAKIDGALEVVSLGQAFADHGSGDGSVEVRVEAVQDAYIAGDAVAVSVAIGFGAATGVGLVNNVIGGSVEAFIEDATVTSTNTTISAFSKAEIPTTRSTGAAGGLIAVQTNLANAVIRTLVDAYAENATLASSGDIVISAMADNQASAESVGGAVGLVPVGVMIADITLGTSGVADVRARLGDGMTVNAGSVTVSAMSVDDLLAQTSAASIGAISGAGANSSVTSHNLTLVEVGDGTTVNAETFSLRSVHSQDFDSSADSVTFGLGAGTWVGAQNTLNSGANITIGTLGGTGAEVSADTIFIKAVNQFSKNRFANSNNLNAASAALGSVSVLQSATELNAEAVVSIHDGSRLTALGSNASPGVFEIEAINNITATDSVRVETVSGLGMAVGLSKLDVDSFSRINVSGSVLENKTGDIYLATKTNSELRPSANLFMASAISGVASANVDALNTVTNRIDVDRSTIKGSDLYLYAGRNINGETDRLEASANSEIVAVSLAPSITVPVVTADIDEHNLINITGSAAQPTKLQALEDVNLFANTGIGFEQGQRATTDGLVLSLSLVPYGMEVPDRASDTPDNQVNIGADYVTIEAGLNNMALLRILPFKVGDSIQRDLIGDLMTTTRLDGVGTDDLLTPAELAALGLPAGLKYHYAPLDLSTIEFDISQRTIVRAVKDTHGNDAFAGGTENDYYQYLPESGSIVLEQENYANASRWRHIGPGLEPKDEQYVVYRSDVTVAFREALENKFYVIKPVELEAPRLNYVNLGNLLIDQRDQILAWIVSHNSDPEAVARYQVQLEILDQTLEDLGLTQYFVQVPQNAFVIAPDGHRYQYKGASAGFVLPEVKYSAPDWDGSVSQTVGANDIHYTSTNGELVIKKELDALFLDLPKIFASPGSVFIEADDLSLPARVAATAAYDALRAGGKLIARAGAQIDITNKTPFSMVVDDTLVRDNKRVEIVDGVYKVFTPGQVWFNSESLSGEPTGVAPPQIDIVQDAFQISQYDLGGLTFPKIDQDIFVVGDVINENGGLLIDNREGSINVSGTLRAETIVIKAAKDFTLNTDGWFHTNQDPRQYIDYDAQRAKALYASQTAGVVSSLSAIFAWFGINNTSEPTSENVIYASRTQELNEAINRDESSILAQGRIGITARFLNIDGLIQSGVDTIKLRIDSNFRPGNRIVTFTDDDGKTLPGIRFGDSGDIQVPLDGYFDPEQGIVLEDIVPSGGTIILAGQVLSTGNGRLRVANGYTSVDIENNSNYRLVLNRIDTTTYREGKIVIIDTARLQKDEYVYDSSGSSPVVRHTTYEGQLVSLESLIPAADFVVGVTAPTTIFQGDTVQLGAGGDVYAYLDADSIESSTLTSNPADYEGSPNWQRVTGQTPVDPNGVASAVQYTQVGTTNLSPIGITYAPRAGLQYLWVEGQDKTQVTVTKYEKKSFNLFGDNAFADMLVRDNSWVSKDIRYTDKQPLLESEVLAINLTAQYDLGALPSGTTHLTLATNDVVRDAGDAYYRYLGAGPTIAVASVNLSDTTLWRFEGSAAPAYADNTAYTINYELRRDINVALVKNVSLVKKGNTVYRYIDENADLHLPSQDYTDTKLWSSVGSGSGGGPYVWDNDPGDPDIGFTNPDIDQFEWTYENKSIDADTWTTGGGWLRKKTVHTRITEVVGLKDVYTHTLKADYPISVGFIQGPSNPVIDIWTRGDLFLEGDIESPEHGVINLTSLTGSITSKAEIAVYGATPRVVAGTGAEDVISLSVEGIKRTTDARHDGQSGTPVTLHPGDLVTRTDGLYRYTGSQQVNFNLTGATYTDDSKWLKVANRSLYATAGGDISIRAISPSNTYSRLVVDMVSSTFGDVVLSAPQGITAAGGTSLVGGDRVELFGFDNAGRGELGAAAQPLRIDSNRMGSGGLAAKADNGIYLREATGGLRLILPQTWAGIASVHSVAGSVTLWTDAGDVVDGIVELARTKESLDLSSIDPKLIDALTGTPVTTYSTNGEVRSLSFQRGTESAPWSANLDTAAGAGPLATTTSGTGSGLTLDVTTDSFGNVVSVTVVNAGTGYRVGDTVTIVDPNSPATISVAVRELVFVAGVLDSSNLSYNKLLYPLSPGLISVLYPHSDLFGTSPVNDAGAETPNIIGTTVTLNTVGGGVGTETGVFSTSGAELEGDWASLDTALMVALSSATWEDRIGVAYKLYRFTGTGPSGSGPSRFRIRRPRISPRRTGRRSSSTTSPRPVARSISSSRSPTTARTSARCWCNSAAASSAFTSTPARTVERSTCRRRNSIPVRG